MISSTRRAAEWPTLIVELVLLLVATWFALRLNPSGFGGGPFDDQRYFDAARAWLAHPPLVGKTHWEMRHPFIVPLAGLFWLRGATIATGMLVPTIVSLAFAAINFAAIRQAAESRVAWTWALIFLTMPLFLRIGTSIFPDILELLFASCALWALWFGRLARRPALLFAISGLCAALAVMSRETSAWLAIVYAYCLFFRPGVRRIDYAWIGAFAVAPLLIEWAWLYLATGDPLYRVHVAMRVVELPSDHMHGHTAHVDYVLFNPAVGRLWIPSGMFHLHWAINPVLNLLADPKFGLAIWGAILFAIMPVRRGTGRVSRLNAGLILPLVLIAVLNFAFVTYALMMQQDQRYYGATLYCIALIAALLGDRLWLAGRGVLVTIVVLAIALSNVVLATQMRRFDDVASVALPLIRSNAGPIHTTSLVAGKLRQPLHEAGLSGRVVVGPPPPSGLLLIVQDGSAEGSRAIEPELGQTLIDRRGSDLPFILRWVRSVFPYIQLPAPLTRGGTRAALVRVQG